MNIPLHVSLRRKFRNLLYKFLSLFIKNDASDKTIDISEVHTILIVRPNYRIGNLIFLTPLITQLKKHIPNLQIDMIVGLPLAGKILQEIPSVKNVYTLPRDILYKPHKLFSLIKQVRATQYDVVLNISAGSLSSELVTLMSNARYKVSFKSDKTIIPLTHRIKKENPYTHAGSKPLELLKVFNIELPEKAQMLDIAITHEEKNYAKKELNTLFQNKPFNQEKIITIFRHARFDKKIEDSWWSAWFEALKELDNNIVVIDILSPDIKHKLHNDMLSYQNKNLRILGAFFAQTALYVSADTGPLHLALASGAKTLALFNKTDSASYGTLGEGNLTLDINNRTPQEVAQITYNLLKGGDN